MNATEIPRSPDALRRTALVLHSLAPEDRAWILGRLPERNRLQVMPCLAELASLGIPRDESLVGSAMPDEEAPPTAPQERVDAAVARLASILEGEPASVVATVLRTRPDTERDLVLRGLPSSCASQVRVLLALPTEVPPGLAAALEDEIANARPRTVRMPRLRSALVRRWQAGWLRISGVFE
jgi:hypothetical protein